MLQLQNQTVVDAVARTEAHDLRAGDRGSTAAEFIEPGTGERGAGRWVRVAPEEFELDAGTQQLVRLSVEIPRDARPGGHYAGVRFITDQAGPTGDVATTAEVDALVLVTVAGGYDHDLRVRAIATDGWRWRGGRASWEVELHNAGDVHEVISGKLAVDGMLSGVREIPMRPAILLPGERRTQRFDVDLREAPDRVVATAAVRADGADEPQRTAAPAVYVLPWWLLAVAVLVVALVTWRVRTVRRWEQAE